MLPDNFDFDAFSRSHMMCSAISSAAIALLDELTGGNLYGPPLCLEPLERLRQAQRAYEEYVAIPAPTPPYLRVVQ
jgi:hypothetical protein